MKKLTRSIRSSLKKKKKNPIKAKIETWDSEYEFSVEKIVGKKVKDGVLYYEVKWLGYESDQNTWEPLSNLGNAMKSVEIYENNRLEIGEKLQVSDVVSKSKHIKKTKKSKQKKFIHKEQINTTPISQNKKNVKEEYKSIKREELSRIKQQKLNASENLELEGHFNQGDKPKGIVCCKPTENGEVLFEVEWIHRKNGEQPQNRIFTSKELRKFDSDLIINFYESRLKFVNKT